MLLPRVKQVKERVLNDAVRFRFNKCASESEASQSRMEFLTDDVVLDLLKALVGRDGGHVEVKSV